MQCRDVSLRLLGPIRCNGSALRSRLDGSLETARRPPSRPHWDALEHRTVRAQLLNGFAGDRQVLGLAERTAIASDGGFWKVFGEGYVFVRTGGFAATFGPGTAFDMNASRTEHVRLFHRTSRRDSERILHEGFRDSSTLPSLAGIRSKGVWFTDTPAVEVPGVVGDAVLEVQLDRGTVDRYRLLTPYRGFDEVCVPAHVVNSFSPPTLVQVEEARG